MTKRFAIVTDGGKRRKRVTDDPGKRLREAALTAAESRAQAERARARAKLEWFLSLAPDAVTK